MKPCRSPTFLVAQYVTFAIVASNHGNRFVCNVLAAEMFKVSLEVSDILGRRVRTLVDGVMHAGRTNVNFYATDLSGGLYLNRLTFGQRRLTGTMILTK